MQELTNRGASDAPEGWRSYFRRRRSDVRRLADAYPDRRSLSVDVLDLYDVDEDLVTALFESPDRVLREGADVLRNAHDAFDRVHLRVENHPELLPLDRLGAGHLGELVTVDGVVEAVGPVRATAFEAVHECPNCGDRIRTRPDGIRLREPCRCERCDWSGPFALRHDGSTFVDLQRVTFAADGDDPRTVPVFLSDDLVGTVDPGNHLLVTGVVRAKPVDDSNRFDLYVDANSIAEEHGGGRREGLAELIRSKWNAG